MAVVDVLARLKADSSQFTSSMRDAEKSLSSLSTTAVTKGTIIGNVLYKAGETAARGLANLVRQGAETAATYQQTTIAFNTMLNSAEKAETFLADLAAFAAKTPFEFTGLVQATRKMMAYGFAADEVIPSLTAIGDAVAGLGLGQEGIDRIVRALGQMRAKGKVSGEEVRQLAEAGIPAYRILAEAAGTTTKKIMELGEKGALPAEQSINALLHAMEYGIGSVRGFGGLMEAQSKTIFGALSNMRDAVDLAFIQGFQPFSENAGRAIQNLVPAIQGAVIGIVSVVGYLIKSISNVASALGNAFGPAITTIVLPALSLAGMAVYGLLQGINGLANFIRANVTVFQVLAAAVVGATGAILVLRATAAATGAVMLLLAKAKQAYAFATYAAAGATNVFTIGMNALTTAIKRNPIGFILSAVIALGSAFVVAWNKSETFRKVVIAGAKLAVDAIAFVIQTVGVLAEGFANLVVGPVRLFLKAMSFFSPKAKEAYDNLKNGLIEVGNFFDKTADKVRGFKKTLEGLQNKTFSFNIVPKLKKPKVDLGKDFSMPDFGFDPDAFADEIGAGDALKGVQKDVEAALRDYNDFIRYEFADGFTQGADGARNAILRGLDELKKVFDEQAKGLDEAGQKKIKDAFLKVNDEVRAFIPQAEAVAAQLEQVEQQLSEATRRLENANRERARAVETFGDLLRTPFGEPSKIAKALSDGNATVDSIINMYDELSQTIEQRFTDIGGPKKDELLNFLNKQTTELITLAKRREKAVEMLSGLEDDLKQLLTDQANFAKKLKSSMSDFATGLADLSKGDEKASIKVIKTASGLVITQVKNTTSGIDKITNQLKDRLAQVVAFSGNIQKLLASGLDPAYIRQLVEAGPEAAGETVAVLAQASAAQIAELNKLYTTINTEAEKFGQDMSKVFYQNSIDMTTALRDGAKAEVDSINATMTSIKDGIEAALAPLRDLGAQIGEDLAQGLYNKLLAEKERLVALAQSIAAAIAAAMASALAGIGVSGAATYTPPSGSSAKLDELKKKTEELKKKTEALRAKITAPKISEEIKTLQDLRDTTKPGTGINFKLKEQIDELTDKLKAPTVTSSVDERTRLQAMGVIPTRTPIGAGDFRMRENAGVTANVTINTQKVTPTVTATTVADAVSRSLLARRTA